MDHQAFAQLLGNYGEFVGAIAVVITLVYLAVQVKHSRAATEANTKQLESSSLSRHRVPATCGNSFLRRYTPVSLPGLVNMSVKHSHSMVNAHGANSNEWVKYRHGPF